MFCLKEAFTFNNTINVWKVILSKFELKDENQINIRVALKMNKPFRNDAFTF